MPELPEVEMARRRLESGALCQRIENVTVRDARILDGSLGDILERRLTGLQFRSARRHGKRLFLELSPDLWLTLHLGLTGDLVCLLRGEQEPGHTRLLITFDNGCRLAFSDSRIFGRVGLAPSPEKFLQEHGIGPDALEIDTDGFLRILQGKRAMIKALLLNQGLIAGLGNLYADEALFQAGISPMARSLDESALRKLFCSVQEVLRASLRAQEELGPLPDSFLLGHRYPGGRCPRDGEALKAERIAGRTSYYCPKHQRIDPGPEQSSKQV